MFVGDYLGSMNHSEIHFYSFRYLFDFFYSDFPI